MLKYTHMSKVFAMLVIALSFIAIAHGQTRPSHNQKSCHENTRLCVALMKSQLNLVAAYVQRRKPGDKVSFNPQPDPPGDPDPWYLRAHEAYKNLQQEISDLSKYPPGPCKTGVCRNAIDDAADKLGRLGQSSDRDSANTAVAAMKPCIKRLSQLLPGPVVRK